LATNELAQGGCRLQQEILLAESAWQFVATQILAQLLDLWLLWRALSVQRMGRQSHMGNA
jgi:hypothetical protein